MNPYTTVIKEAESLKERYPKMSDFECLQIASQIQISQTLLECLTPGYGKDPNCLEAVAIALGHDQRFGSSSIKGVLSEIVEKLDSIKEEISDIK